MKQSIPWVRVTFADGKQVEYLDDDVKLTKVEIDQAEKHRMDCIDCHNRASHYLKSPDLSLDEALANGLIDKSLPQIKKKGMEVLTTKYPSVNARLQAIDGLVDFYRTDFPQVYDQKKEAIQSAIAAIKQIETSTNFPQLEVDWQTYPNNVGHKEFPGCFRCHDGKHIAQDPTSVAPERLSIRLQCNVCHSIPETVAAGQQPQFTAIVPKTEPAYHGRSDWMARHPKQVDATCAACHGEIKYNARPTLDNQSFCANISCHGTGWKRYISLIEIQSPGLPSLPVPGAPVPGVPSATPAPGTPAQPATPKPAPAFPASHAGRTADTCLACHKPAAAPPTAGTPAPTVATAATPTAPAAATPAPTAPAVATPAPTAKPGSEAPDALPADHAGRTSEMCLLCHGPSGQKPVPASHAGRTGDTCLVCHKPK